MWKRPISTGPANGQQGLGLSEVENKIKGLTINKQAQTANDKKRSSP
jgi:hypothetical protein